MENNRNPRNFRRVKPSILTVNKFKIVEWPKIYLQKRLTNATYKKIFSRKNILHVAIKNYKDLTREMAQLTNISKIVFYTKFFFKFWFLYFLLTKTQKLFSLNDFSNCFFPLKYQSVSKIGVIYVFDCEQKTKFALGRSRVCGQYNGGKEAYFVSKLLQLCDKTNSFLHFVHVVSTPLFIFWQVVITVWMTKYSYQCYSLGTTLQKNLSGFKWWKS